MTALKSDGPADIRLFVAAYELRSFTEAAAREGATQSGVSQHVRKLEARFGVRLFQRDAAGVTPTPAGDAYYWRCLAVLRAHADAAAGLRNFAQGIEEAIDVGLMPTMTRCVLAPSLARAIALHPNLKIRITEAYSGLLLQQVRQGALDFAIVPAPTDTAGLEVQSFADTPELLVAAPRPGGDHLAPLRLRDLGPLKLVLPGPANTRRQTLATYCASHGAELVQILELDSMMATLDLVARTDWLAILPGLMMARDRTPGRFLLNKLADPALTLALVSVARLDRPQSQGAAAFREILAAESGRLNAGW